MHIHKRAIHSYLYLMLVSFLLTACGNSEPVDHSQHEKQAISTHMSKTDECHLCGMVIQQFPGPKGQLLEKHTDKVQRFCSTNDLFSYALQPENQHNIKSILVHDMSEVAWESPNDTQMLEADKAWYVAEHDLHGAMGPTIAAFGTEEAAHAFQQKQGGYVLRYSDITLELMAKLMQMSMHAHH